MIMYRLIWLLIISSFLLAIIKFKQHSLRMMQAPIPEGYSNRYEKIKSTKLRSLSPCHSHQPDQQTVSPGPPHLHTSNHPNKHAIQENDNRLGKVVSDLTDRVDGIQIKIVNITNIIKLFQRYTETKDMQYEKEKESEEFSKKYGKGNVQYIENLDMQAKINEMQGLIQRTKVQMTAMEGLRVNIERENSKKFLNSPDIQTITRTLQSPQSPNNAFHSQTNRQIMQEIQDIMDRMQENLREEMNKKIDICMNFYKNAVQSLKDTFQVKGNTKLSRNSSPPSPGNVNTLMLQEQIHNMTLTVNKVESDCLRNKMIIEHKIQQIVAYIQNMKKSDPNQQTLQISRRSRSTNRRAKPDPDQISNRSQHSSISKKSKQKQKQRDKSKSKRKTLTDHQNTKSPSISISIGTGVGTGINSTNRLQEQKRQKQLELKQALKKKRENQEKLKMKR